MEFAPEDFQQVAGLTVFYDTFNFFYLFLSSTGEGENEIRILVRDNLRFYDPLNGGVPAGKTEKAWLRAWTQDLTIQFSYSLDGKAFIPVASPLDASDLSDEAYFGIGHKGHTGTLIGMACQDLSGRKLHADLAGLRTGGLKNSES